MSGQGERATDHLWDARYEAQPTESIRRWSYCCERPQSEHPGLTWDSLTAATDAGAAGDAVADAARAFLKQCPDAVTRSDEYRRPRCSVCDGKLWTSTPHEEDCEYALLVAALASAEGATEVDGG